MAEETYKIKITQDKDGEVQAEPEGKEALAVITIDAHGAAAYLKGRKLKGAGLVEGGLITLEVAQDYVKKLEDERRKYPNRPEFERKIYAGVQAVLKFAVTEGANKFFITKVVDAGAEGYIAFLKVAGFKTKEVKVYKEVTAFVKHVGSAGLGHVIGEAADPVGASDRVSQAIGRAGTGTKSAEENFYLYYAA